MDSKRSAVHASKYFLLTSLFALVGLAFVAGGAALGGAEALDTYNATESVTQALSEAWLGIVLAVIGLLVYRLGKAWALYKTLTDATEEALEDTYDTQRVKSDIVSVLDDRLSDMQTDLQSVNRELRKLRGDEQFEFGNGDD